MKDIKIKSGTTETIQLLARNAAKVAVNITGYTSATLKIAKALNVANGDALHYVLVLSANFSDGANGIHDFVLSEDTTKAFAPGNYMYQTRLIDSTGVVSDTDVGNLIVEQNLIDDEA